MISRLLSYLLVIHVFLFGSIFGCMEVLHTYVWNNTAPPVDHCCTDNHNDKIQSWATLQYTQEGSYKFIPALFIKTVFDFSYSEKKEVIEKKFIAHIDKQSFFFVETVRLLL